jgi:AraC-like DNA-binding protein
VRVFTAWTSEFFEEYERHHPVLPADRLAGLIRKQPDRPWTVASLAKAAGVPARGLARAFRRKYGESVRTYVHLCRMNAMLSSWSHT